MQKRRLNIRVSTKTTNDVADVLGSRLTERTEVGRLFDVASKNPRILAFADLEDT